MSNPFFAPTKQKWEDQDQGVVVEAMKEDGAEVLVTTVEAPLQRKGTGFMWQI